jgi:hypothetical protein
VALFDNVGSDTRTQSDIFCRAITGSGIEKRELYTTDESHIRQFMHVVGMNGVSMPVERGDLFSRVILLPFKKLPEDTPPRRWAETKHLIKKDTPQLIGAMLTVLVDAIGIYPTVKSRLAVRMGDFVKWGCAITLALGLPEVSSPKIIPKHVTVDDVAPKLNLLGSLGIFIEWSPYSLHVKSDI